MNTAGENIDEVKEFLSMKGREQSVHIESDVLEPANISQNTATWNIRKAGILAPSCRIILPLYASNATTRLTALGGAFGVISSATLRTSGGEVIAQTNDVNYLCSIYNQFVSQERRRRRGRIENGTYQVYSVTTDDAGDISGLLSILGADQPSRFRLSQDSSVATQYSIQLGELFPQLYPFSIPLFALEESLQLYITFSANGATGDRAVASDGDNDNIGDVLLNTADCVFVSDHLFYDEKIMNRIRSATQSRNGIVLPFADYTLVKFSQLAPAAPAADQVTTKTFRNSIGLSGCSLKHILIHNSRQTADGKPTEAGKIVGHYNSMDARTTDRDASVNRVSQSLQIKINNENYYPSALPSTGFYRELEQVFGVAPSIPYCAYNCFGSFADTIYKDQLGAGALYTLIPNNGFTDKTAYATNQQFLAGSSCIIGVNFAVNPQQNGGATKRIGLQPVEIEYQRTYSATDTYNLTQRIFACCQRIMSIKDGQIKVNFS